MLESIRRYSSAWIVKTIFGLIIISFVFFFGYQSLSSNPDNSFYVARVDSIGISKKRFESLYQSSVERMQGNFPGGIPESFQGFLRQNVLNRLIERHVTILFGQSLGFQVSDEQIAETIRANKTLFPDGRFDQTLYETRFLPYYEQSYGENFEETVRRDILVGDVELLATTLFEPWSRELTTSLAKHAPKDSKKTKKKDSKTPESQALTESLSPDQLFSFWIDGFKKKVHIENYESL